MKTKLIVGSIALAALIMPVQAQTTTEFYVVQDAATKKCTIVDKKPTASTTTVVSPSGTVYKTRSEAETAMKSVKVCTTN
jgi:hypothetical protein